MRFLLPRRNRPDPLRSLPAAEVPAPDPKVRICVHGLFRSGTNFFRALVEANLDCKVEYDDFGWKHAFFPIATRHSRVRLPPNPSVVVTKNPLAALESLHRYASGNPRNVRREGPADLSGFLREPIVVFDGSNPASVEYRFRSPVDYWNAMNWNLFSRVRKTDRALHVRYEDLVSDPAASLGRVAAAFGLARRGGAAAAPSCPSAGCGISAAASTIPTGSSRARATTDQASWPADYAAAFGPDDLAYLDAELCWPLVADLGYAETCRSMIDRPGADG